jgi:carbon monoxide dehydrogenase subunit G
MPSFSHSIEVSKPPAEVFPWLLEEDKVPRWTSELASYEQLGPLGPGAKVKQVLSFGGSHVTLDVDVTRYEAPQLAETRFSTNGVEITNTFEPTGAGSRVTQRVDAKPTSLTARMVIPVVQGRLEKKLADDLERLRSVIGG